MNAMRALVTGGLGLLAASNLAMAAEQRPLVDTPELVVTRHGGTETIAMPGGAYSGFTIDAERASFVLEGQALPAGDRTLRGAGISKVRWTPLDTQGKHKSTQVEIEFASEPLSSLLNAVHGTPGRPQTAQVLAGFIFDRPARPSGGQSVMGSRENAGAPPADSSRHGGYKLPRFPDVKYSDALVTLKVVNADFRDVLDLLCNIGGVSYVIDPYYQDEPTGNIRSGKGGGTGGQGNGQPGGGGVPPIPEDGTGSITLNFNQVPFDQALELLLETAGLVKTDIYPKSGS